MQNDLQQNDLMTVYESVERLYAEYCRMKIGSWWNDNEQNDTQTDNTAE